VIHYYRWSGKIKPFLADGFGGSVESSDVLVLVLGQFSSATQALNAFGALFGCPGHVFGEWGQLQRLPFHALPESDDWIDVGFKAAAHG